MIQVDGKVRDRILVPAGISDGEAETRAMRSKRVQEALKQHPAKKEIVVPDRLVYLVT